MVYDTAIIGTGPAGVSAALNLKIHQTTFVWIGSRNLSDKISKAEKISNYPGFLYATGTQLNDAFRRQIEEMGIEITEAMVNTIYRMGDHYALAAGANFYETKTVILTTGIVNRNVLPGENELVGRGVSYCATCDGGLYRGRKIAVICNNRRFEHEVKYLSDLAAKVYYFPGYKEVSDLPENVEKMNVRAVSIDGGERVSQISLSDGTILPVDGVFCLRDSISLATLLPGLETKDGHIAVDRAMATNLRGCFAAGDCTGRPYQYTKAVGEGNVAAHSVIEYLADYDK